MSFSAIHFIDSLLPKRRNRLNPIQVPFHKTVVRISHKQFLEMYDKDPNSVSGAKLIPPTIGSANDFGAFEILMENTKELELIE